MRRADLRQTLWEGSSQSAVLGVWGASQAQVPENAVIGRGKSARNWETFKMFKLFGAPANIRGALVATLLAGVHSKRGTHLSLSLSLSLSQLLPLSLSFAVALSLQLSIKNHAHKLAGFKKALRPFSVEGPKSRSGAYSEKFGSDFGPCPAASPIFGL